MTTKKKSTEVKSDILEIEVGQIETAEYISILNPEFFSPRTGVTEEWTGDIAQVIDGDRQKLATILKLGMGVYTVSALVDSEGEITSVNIRKM